MLTVRELDNDGDSTYSVSALSKPSLVDEHDAQSDEFGFAEPRVQYID